MTIAPATLSQMIASSRLEATKAAILASLRLLMKGVTIVSHPGKLDINDVMEKAIVSAPGIALGWSRLRGQRDIGGSFGVPVDWAAYIVTEDFADTKATPPRRIERDVLALAIGNHLLRILHDADTPYWGLTGISEPSTEAPPEMRPVLTMKSAESGTAIFVVTWTQYLLFEGASFFGGPTPAVRSVPDGIPEGMEFDIADGDLPTEILAVLRRENSP